MPADSRAATARAGRLLERVDNREQCALDRRFARSVAAGGRWLVSGDGRANELRAGTPRAAREDAPRVGERERVGADPGEGAGGRLALGPRAQLRRIPAGVRRGRARAVCGRAAHPARARPAAGGGAPAAAERGAGARRQQEAVPRALHRERAPPARGCRARRALQQAWCATPSLTHCTRSSSQAITLHHRLCECSTSPIHDCIVLASLVRKHFTQVLFLAASRCYLYCISYIYIYIYTCIRIYKYKTLKYNTFIIRLLTKYVRDDNTIV